MRTYLTSAIATILFISASSASYGQSMPSSQYQAAESAAIAAQAATQAAQNQAAAQQQQPANPSYPPAAAAQAQYPQAQYPQAQYPQAQYPQAQGAPATSYASQQGAPQSAPQSAPSQLPPLPSDFELGAREAMPITPSEIRELRRMLDARQKAVSEIPNPPKSQTGSVSVSLDPGSSPAIIRPFFGVSTSLVLVDSTGAPWPVENFVVGNRALFVIERLDSGTGSSFVISPLQSYGQSNLILKLAGIATPVVVNLVLGQKVHDARVEARVQGRGPNSVVSNVSLTPGVDSRLLGVLDGVPPGGRELSVKVVDGRSPGATRAWMAPDGKMWMRTALNVISPAPLSFVSSADGMHVYRLDPSSKVLAMLDGAFLTLTLDGCLQECGVSSP